MSFPQRRARIIDMKTEAKAIRAKINRKLPWRERRRLRALAKALEDVAVSEELSLPGQERIYDHGIPQTHVGTGPARDDGPATPLTADQRRAEIEHFEYRRNVALSHIESGEYRSLVGGKRRLRREAKAFQLVAEWAKAQLVAEP